MVWQRTLITIFFIAFLWTAATGELLGTVVMGFFTTWQLLLILFREYHKDEYQKLKSEDDS